MRENGFMDQGWETASIAEVVRSLPRRELIVAESRLTRGRRCAPHEGRGRQPAPGGG
jgi:hypothetical protein